MNSFAALQNSKYVAFAKGRKVFDFLAIAYVQQPPTGRACSKDSRNLLLAFIPGATTRWARSFCQLHVSRKVKIERKTQHEIYFSLRMRKGSAKYAGAIFTSSSVASNRAVRISRNLKNST